VLSVGARGGGGGGGGGGRTQSFSLVAIATPVKARARPKRTDRESNEGQGNTAELLIPILEKMILIVINSVSLKGKVLFTPMQIVRRRERGETASGRKRRAATGARFVRESRPGITRPNLRHGILSEENYLSASKLGR